MIHTISDVTTLIVFIQARPYQFPLYAFVIVPNKVPITHTLNRSEGVVVFFCKFWVDIYLCSFSTSYGSGQESFKIYITQKGVVSDACNSKCILYDDYLLVQFNMYGECSLENIITQKGVESKEELSHGYEGPAP